MPPQPGTEGSSWAKAGTAVATVSAAMSIATHRTKKIRLISRSPPFRSLRRRCCPQTTELSRVVRGVKELAPTHWEATVATTYSNYRQEFFSETQFPAFTILGNRGGIKRGLGHHSCPALLLRLLLSRVYVEDGIEISAWGNS